MFNSKTKTEAPATKGSVASIIGNGAILHGDMTCDNDLRIDGKLIGNIHSTAKVVIGTNGVVEGNVVAQTADIMGITKGMLRVKDILNLRGDATIDGDIYAGKLSVEPTVTLNGHCYMGANVVEMNKEETLAIAK